jgi:hypothetical protein
LQGLILDEFNRPHFHGHDPEAAKNRRHGVTDLVDQNRPQAEDKKPCKPDG